MNVEHHGNERHHGTAEVDLPVIEELAFDAELDAADLPGATEHPHVG